MSLVVRSLRVLCIFLTLFIPSRAIAKAKKNNCFRFAATVSSLSSSLPPGGEYVLFFILQSIPIGLTIVSLGVIKRNNFP